MQDKEGLRGAAAGDRVRSVALALIEAGTAPLSGRARLLLSPDGPTVLERIVSSAQETGWVRRVIVLASGGELDEDCDAEAERLGVECLRGAKGPGEALRMLGAPPDQVVLRLSLSCPLLCPEVIGAAIEVLLGGGCDSVCTDLGSGVLPVGLDLEACHAGHLFALEERGRALSFTGAQRQRTRELSPGELGPSMERSGRYYASFRLLLENPEDVPLLHAVSSLLERQLEPRGLHSLLRLLDLHPEWRTAIQHVIQLRPTAAAILG